LKTRKCFQTPRKGRHHEKTILSTIRSGFVVQWPGPSRSNQGGFEHWYNHSSTATTTAATNRNEQKLWFGRLLNNTKVKRTDGG
jgi:hypothetical protein